MHGRAGNPAWLVGLQLSFHDDASQQSVSEFLMMAPDADWVVPMFAPLLLDEPVAVNGKMKVPDTPGFGVRLNPEVHTQRPYAR